MRARLQGVPHEGPVGEGPRAEDGQAEGLGFVQDLDDVAAALGVRGAHLDDRNRGADRIVEEQQCGRQDEGEVPLQVCNEGGTGRIITP